MNVMILHRRAVIEAGIVTRDLVPSMFERVATWDNVPDAPFGLTIAERANWQTAAVGAAYQQAQGESAEGTRSTTFGDIVVLVRTDHVQYFVVTAAEPLRFWAMDDWSMRAAFERAFVPKCARPNEYHDNEFGNLTCVHCGEDWNTIGEERFSE